MAELLQHILSLPQSEQLAIVQAIVSNLQSQDTDSDILAKQFEYAENIAKAIDANKVDQVPLTNFQKEMTARRLKRKGA